MRICLFLDYDGTLVPIQSAPEKAVIAPKVKKLLKELSGNPAIQVAIVSGRSLQNITSLVGLKGLIYVGNHGLEISGPGIKHEVMAGKGFAKIVARINVQLSEELSSVRGVLIENKGLTLSLHYRLVAPDKLPAVKRVFRDITRPYIKMKKITVNPGKKVLELKPVINWNKGKAVLWILKKFGSIPRETFPIYIGDDATDESAFKALAKHGITIFVGEARKTKARYRLKGPRQVMEFLNRIKKEEVLC